MAMTNNEKHRYSEPVNVHGELKRDLSFCWRAVFRSPDPQEKIAMRHLYIHDTPAGKTCAATDGPALHIVHPLFMVGCRLENGLYRVFKETKDCFQIGRLLDPVGKFPNYEKVIPKYSYYLAVYRSGLSLYDYGSFIDFIEFDKQCPFALLPSNLARLSGEKMKWNVSWGRDESKPVVFESGRYKAVIMPLSWRRTE
jgi:hypothetical protein